MRRGADGEFYWTGSWIIEKQDLSSSQQIYPRGMLIKQQLHALMVSSRSHGTQLIQLQQGKVLGSSHPTDPPAVLDQKKQSIYSSKGAKLHFSATLDVLGKI